MRFLIILLVGTILSGCVGQIQHIYDNPQIANGSIELCGSHIIPSAGSTPNMYATTSYKESEEKKEEEGTRVLDTSASGTLIGNGYIISNRHVVQDERLMSICHTENAVEVLSIDEKHDLALLYSKDLVATDGLRFASQPVWMNEPVATRGNRSGKGLYNTYGYVLAPQNEVVVRTDEFENIGGRWQPVENEDLYVELSLSSEPGNSGGPVINQRGELVAILAANNDEGTISSAVPLEYVKEFLASLVWDGKTRMFVKQK